MRTKAVLTTPGWMGVSNLVSRLKGLFMSAGGDEFKPHFLQRVDIDSLFHDLSMFFGVEDSLIRTLWSRYSALSDGEQYTVRLGERKTLSKEEAFVLYVGTMLFAPPTMVEIGTQYGKSTRRLIDMRKELGIKGQMICFDVANMVRHFTLDEAQLNIKDVTQNVRSDILDKYKTGLIFLDAHPYHLLLNVIESVLQDSRWILAIHDCGRGLCNPRMRQEKDDPDITSKTGHWERHVLAKVFGIPNPLSIELDRAETPTHLLRVFSTQHGLAVILPKQLTARRLRDVGS